MDISRSLFRRIASRDDNCSDKQKGKYDDIDELKDVAQVDKQLERYQRDTLRAIRPQQVYCMGFFENKNGLYRISREVELSVLTKPVELKIVAKEFENSLKYSGYKYIHQGEGKIHLQEHIAKKILQFPDAMNDKKKLQQFLGLVNYARNHINNLAKLAGPLYAKLRKNGQKYFNSEDIKLVRLIKEKVKELKPLELPLEESYFIIETDASQQGMKRSMNYAGVECFTFGDDNKLRIFPPNSYKFKPKDHIILDEVQECILDNFWYQYNNKREEKGYLLSILNSLSEYFHLINGSLMPANEDHEVIQQKPIYVVFDGKLPGVYISFEEIVAQKIDAKLMGGISWKKYKDIDEALSQARKILGINYYLEPAAKEYIQKCKKAKGKKTSEIPIKMTIKEEGFFKKPTYKECLTKGVDPLDGEYIDWKIIEKFEEASPQLKKELKEEILKELKQEIDQKFEQIKKAVDEKLEVSFSDLDTMDLGGHGQPDE
uniref:Reverse transcriptase/retrotransposon-derived protein RNase H-like domain-containing protein n=2 Tax=Oryza sativa subsp. japonica TaxID=39947 RepID=Q2QQT4_ORYSJ|nr:hypothetical protein LOC_Os12g29940 [Oryza sativa Japonica Group]